jgi:hypothetical protein
MEGVLNAEGRDAGPGDRRCWGSKKWWRIWKLECPNKIKHFWWRCVHSSLATRDNLIRRGVKIEDPKCLFCNQRNEDGCHLFVHRKEVKPLWRKLRYESQHLKIEAKETIEEVMDVLWI